MSFYLWNRRHTCKHIMLSHYQTHYLVIVCLQLGLGRFIFVPPFSGSFLSSLIPFPSPQWPFPQILSNSKVLLVLPLYPKFFYPLLLAP